MQKEGKQFYHNKPDTYTWNILPISAGTTTPELFFIKCDDAGTPIEPSTGFAVKFTFPRIENDTVYLDSDFCWIELTEDNIFEYDGAAVTNIVTFYQTITSTTF